MGSTGAAARSDTLVWGGPRPGSKCFPCPGVSEVGTDPHSETGEVGDESPMEEGAQGLGRVCGLLLRELGQGTGGSLVREEKGKMLPGPLGACLLPAGRGPPPGAEPWHLLGINSR